MKILIAHNSYQQSGGEDRAVAAEIAMLEANGHQVVQYRLSNDAVPDMSALALAARTVWSRPAFSDLRRLLRRHRPQIAHFHNTLPLISPAGYYAARAENVPVVQTLHNFRLCCVSATLFRAGTVCEDCVGAALPAWHGVVHGCYRGSRAASAAVATMLAAHRALGTWRNAVDAYIALSDFSRRKFVESGLPADKIAVKPNFVHPDPGPGSGAGGYAIYVGRLVPEKGLHTLIRAWTEADGLPPLKIVGDGPLAPLLEKAVAAGTLEWLRHLPHEDVCRLIGEAAVLVVPSEWHEPFGLVAIEAFAKGTPVVAAARGALPEIVEDGRTGLHFRAADPADLVVKVRALLADPAALARMRRAARAAYERKFNTPANHEALMAVYARARSCRAPARDEIARLA
jgi:glycosyltransferase involved in cell wall biosynthesis